MNACACYQGEEVALASCPAPRNCCEIVRGGYALAVKLAVHIHTSGR